MYRAWPNVSESFFQQNSAISGTFGDIDTFGDMGTKIYFFIQKVKTRGRSK
jgi:hypothetical protein